MYTGNVFIAALVLAGSAVSGVGALRPRGVMIPAQALPPASQSAAAVMAALESVQPATTDAIQNQDPKQAEESMPAQPKACNSMLANVTNVTMEAAKNATGAGDNNNNNNGTKCDKADKKMKAELEKAAEAAKEIKDDEFKKRIQDAVKEADKVIIVLVIDGKKADKKADGKGGNKTDKKEDKKKNKTGNMVNAMDKMTKIADLLAEGNKDDDAVMEAQHAVKNAMEAAKMIESKCQ